MSGHVDCDHGSDPMSCPVCRPTSDAGPTTHVGYPFRARYPGHCRGCNLPIHEGQLTRQVAPAGGDVHYVHDGCEP